MTSRLNIRPFCSQAHLSRHFAALMSLPVSFELDGDREIDIALAQSDGSSLAMAQAARPKALIVADAANLSAAATTQLAHADLPAHPLMILSSLSARLAEIKSPKEASLIRSHFCSQQGLRFTLVEHLSFLEAACGPLTNIRLLRKSKQNYAGQAADSNGAPILWTGQCNASGARFDLDWVATSARLEMVAELGETAQPPFIQVASGQGVSEPKGVYENPLRTFWRRIAGDHSSAAAKTAMAKLSVAIRIVEGFEVDA